MPVNPETAREEELAVRLLESASRVSSAAGIGERDIKNTMREAAACIVSQTAELAGLRTALSRIEGLSWRLSGDVGYIFPRTNPSHIARRALAVSVTPPEGDDG